MLIVRLTFPVVNKWKPQERKRLGLLAAEHFPEMPLRFPDAGIRLDDANVKGPELLVRCCFLVSPFLPHFAYFFFFTRFLSPLFAQEPLETMTSSAVRSVAGST